MGVILENKPYWIKIQKVKPINKIKNRIFLADDDFFDSVFMKDTKFGVDVEKIKVCQIPCFLFRYKKSLYLLEEHIAARDWGGIDEDIC